MTKVVYTGGTWDLFHVGHLNIIKKSKQLGDYLIVGVSTDELVESYKGSKPTIPYRERVRIVKSIKYVDKVVRQDKLVTIKLLKRYKVDVVTIGSDWKNQHLAGLQWMRTNEKKVVYISYTKGISTTLIKESIVKKEGEQGLK